MKEYEVFIDKFGDGFISKLSYNNYVTLKGYVYNMVNDLLSFKGIEAKNFNILCTEIMVSLLRNHRLDNILNGECDKEIEHYVDKIYKEDSISKNDKLDPIVISSKKFKDKKVNQEQNEKIVKSLPTQSSDIKNYVYDLVSKYEGSFEKGVMIDSVSQNITTSLMEARYRKKDILDGKLDSEIVKYLLNGYFGVKFNSKFKERLNTTSSVVYDLFTDMRKQNKDYTRGVEYIYYSDINNLREITFRVASELVREGNVSKDTIYNRAYNITRADLAKINSVVKREERDELIEKVFTRKEVSQEEIERRRKIAIAIAIAMLISGIETTLYYKKHNPDGSLKDNRPKKTYSAKHTAYDVKNESMNISNLQYDYENNEVTLGGEKIAKL